MRRFVAVLWIGFWINAASGVLLLIAYPTKALTNPVFGLKLALIAVAMGIFVVIDRRLFRTAVPDRSGRRVSGACSRWHRWSVGPVPSPRAGCWLTLIGVSP